MRQRNWIFYKVVLYLGLLAAITLLSALCFIAFSRNYSLWRDNTLQLVALGASLQIAFYLMCIRLVHYYVPNRTTPGGTFSVCYLLLLMVNSCLAVGLLVLLAFGFSETFLKRPTRPGREDYSALCIVGAYTFATLYLSASSIVLRRYNRYQVATDEEEWLSQLGEPPSNPSPELP